jgi:hypothetical protein
MDNSHVDRGRSAGWPRASPYTAAARKRQAEARATRGIDIGRVREQAIRASIAPGAYDDPERRPLSERCLLGFGSTSGPPALPDYFYNDLHQIVQTQGLHHDPQRDGSRRPHRPHECAAPSEKHSPAGWAIQ